MEDFHIIKKILRKYPHVKQLANSSFFDCKAFLVAKSNYNSHTDCES